MSIIFAAMLTPTALTALSNAATTAPLRHGQGGSDAAKPRLVRDVPPPVSSKPAPGKRGALLDLRV